MISCPVPDGAPFGVEIGRRLGGEVRAGQSGRQELDHQRQHRALGVAHRQPSCRAAPRRDRWSACPSASSAQPSGIVLAALLRRHDVAARHLRQRQVDHQRRAARQRAGERDRIGAEHGLRSAPRRHRARRVDEHQRDQALVRQPLDRMAGRAAMARTADRRRGDALAARGVGQRGFGKLDRRKGKAVGRRRSRSGRAAAGVTSGVAVPSILRTLACAAYIGTRDRPWPLSPSISAAISARATLRALSMSVRQRVSVPHHQPFRLNQRQRRHELSTAARVNALR